MAVAFKKLKPNRIFQGVVDQIQAAILQGDLGPGDQLPSEMKLKEMFNTSRGTVREALRVLEQKGLIEIKVGVGGGAVVKAIDTQPVTESLDLLVRYRKVSLEHLSEFRESVEGVVAALAAARATAEDVAELKAILARAHKLISHSTTAWEDFVRADIALHIAIARIARNPVFTTVLQVVHENILGYYERFSLKGKHTLEENYVDLCQLVAAIEKGDVAAAKSLAENHVRKFERHMEQKHLNAPST